MKYWFSKYRPRLAQIQLIFVRQNWVLWVDSIALTRVITSWNLLKNFENTPYLRKRMCKLNWKNKDSESSYKNLIDTDYKVKIFKNQLQFNIYLKSNLSFKNFTFKKNWFSWHWANLLFYIKWWELKKTADSKKKYFR